jgi:RNA polymerase sigma-54 factor
MLKQRLEQKLLQKLSPQQIQLMKLIQIPTMELDQRIKQELEENPALEEGAEENYEDNQEENFESIDDYDDSRTEAEKEIDINEYISDDADYKTQINNKGLDDDEYHVPLSQGPSFLERLREQINLHNLSEKQRIIAEVIIGNLDDDGYLSRPLINIVDDLAFSMNIYATEEEVQEVLEIVQDLEPAGVGARDLRECLILQLERKSGSNIARHHALIILENYFEEFTKKHYNRIAQKMELSDDELKDAIEQITRLNPRPGNSSKETGKNMSVVTPDFIITEVDGKLELSLNSKNAPELKVSRSYEQMLRSYAEGAKQSKSDKEALMFIKQKLDSAKWFIDAIKQRENTLYNTMYAIMEYQKAFFLSGDETRLRPMILKDIAEIVNMDISTISRVVNSKYVQTSFGIYPLKYFFSESLSTESGEEVSSREVKKILSDAIAGEDKRKPLTDDKLALLLKENGYNIARRTVAKYREQLNIPVARLRKEL